jgi:hypothetical protein
LPDRIIKLPGLAPINYDRLSAEDRLELDVELAAWDAAVARQPIQGFEWHSAAQREFLAARTKVVAALAGNRFGKTTSLVVKSLIECLPSEVLPERLRRFRRFDERVDGWILCPSEAKVFDSLKPAFELWTGAANFKGGSWGKAFNGERMQLTFSNGSTIGFKTYQQDASTLTGASLWFVGYDEPPPKDHREECRTRLIDHDGFEMFAMTPIKANTGYIKRAIYKKRADPQITLVSGSIHDNATLSKAGIAAWRAGFDENDLWIRAREFGEFVDVGGLIYEDFERRVIPAPAKAELNLGDVVVGIDPGIRNTALVFAAFDSHNTGTVFAEDLLQNARTEDVAQAIWRVLDRYGIGRQAPLFVIDPSVPRAQTSEQTLQTSLAVLGIGCAKAQNSVEAGIQQVRSRLAEGRLWISRDCLGLRDEADEYAAEDRPDGEFKPIKANDHRLDALRYVCMARPWYPHVEAQSIERNLGFAANVAIPARYLLPQLESPPMGSMS